MATSTATTTLPPAALRNPAVAVVDRSASPSLFCFMVVIAQSSERWLVVVQLQQGTGIFGCHQYSLFSDEAVDFGAGPGGPVSAIAIPGDKAWKAPVAGTSENVWHNTAVFMRAWRRIREEGTYKGHPWTVKVDPDTVFLPGILQREMGLRFWLEPETPMFLLNCRQWRSFQGPLEVFSRAAAGSFFGGLDLCEAALEWRAWGEDWFVGHCMQFLGVQGWDAFDLLDDMWCNTAYGDTGHSYLQEYEERGPTCSDGKPAFHPYKTTEGFARCLEQAVR